MRLRNTLWIVIAMVVYGNVGDVWAYGAPKGGSDRPGVCSKVRLMAFTPSAFTTSNKTEVAPKSAFSFFASAGTKPTSITVMIKGQSVPLTVTPKNNGFQVTGMLPGTLKGTFARINITVKGPNLCELNDGWLLKVAN